MKTPVELHNGQIIDLSRCIAIVASTVSNYELIMEGYHQPIGIAQSDALQLQQLLKSSSPIKGFPSRSEEEQQRHNQIAMERLRAIIERDREIQPSPEAEQFFEDFKQIVDNNRPIGKKLFAE